MGFPSADGLQPIWRRETHPETSEAVSSPEFSAADRCSSAAGIPPAFALLSAVRGPATRDGCGSPGVRFTSGHLTRDGFHASGGVASHPRACRPSRDGVASRAGRDAVPRISRPRGCGCCFGMGSTLWEGLQAIPRRETHPETGWWVVGSQPPSARSSRARGPRRSPAAGWTRRACRAPTTRGCGQCRGRGAGCGRSPRSSRPAARPAARRAHGR